MNELSIDRSNHQNIKVDIIMSVYRPVTVNQFEKSINSLINQTHKNIKIIIVIDGEISTDLRKKIDEYCNIYSNIEIIEIYHNMGLSYALNLALSRSNSEFVARMDADDESDCRRIEEQLNYLLNNEDVDVVGSWITEIFITNNKSRIVKFPEKHKDCFELFKLRNPIAHPAAMFRRRFFKKAGKYKNIRFDQDSILWMNGFLHNAIFSNVQKPLYKFYFSDASLINRKNSTIIYLKNRIRIIRKLKFGLKSYIYAIIISCIYNMPIKIKKLIYFKFR